MKQEKGKNNSHKMRERSNEKQTVGLNESALGDDTEPQKNSWKDHEKSGVN